MYEIIQLKKGEEVAKTGEYVVLSGMMVCRASKHLVKFVGQGDTIIFDSLFCNGAIAYEAKQDTKLGKLMNQDSLIFVERRDNQKAQIAQWLLNRIDLLVLPARERIMVSLHQFANQIGSLHDQDCHIPAVLTQVEFSKHVNCSREYLFGIRKKLIEEGWIVKNKRWILSDWSKWEKEIERIAIEYAYMDER